MLHEVKFQSFNERDEVYGWIYVPAAEPKGIVQIIHGYGEHSRRYLHMIVKFMDAGFIVAADDHVGHGKTALENDTWGDWGDKGCHTMMEDEHRLTELVCEKYPNLPYFLFGHSMGSFIARLYARRFGGGIDGLILSGTAGKNPAADLGRALARGVELAKGPRYISDKVYDLANGSFSRAFADARTPVDWLSKDPAVCDAYLQDPLCAFKFTVSAYYELFSMLKECNSAQWYAGMPRKLPILLIAGEKDPVGAMGAGPREVFLGLREAGCNDVTLQLYPQGRHELLNELEKEEVKEDLLEWLEEVMAQVAARRTQEE